MAKISVINRNNKRKQIVHKYSEQRKKLIEIRNNYNLSDDERYAAQIKLQKLPRDSSPVRLRNRCILTGRGRGVYSKFGLGRIKRRELAMEGMVPGIVKASW